MQLFWWKIQLNALILWIIRIQTQQNQHASQYRTKSMVWHSDDISTPTIVFDDPQYISFVRNYSIDLCLLDKNKIPISKIAWPIILIILNTFIRRKVSSAVTKLQFNLNSSVNQTWNWTGRKGSIWRPAPIWKSTVSLFNWQVSHIIRIFDLSCLETESDSKYWKFRCIWNVKTRRYLLVKHIPHPYCHTKGKTNCWIDLVTRLDYENRSESRTDWEKRESNNRKKGKYSRKLKTHKDEGHFIETRTRMAYPFIFATSKANPLLPWYLL